MGRRRRGIAAAVARRVQLPTLVGCFATLALAWAPAASAWAPGPERYGEAVTYDVPITMRDGVVLRADIYRPANPDGTPAKGPFPVLLSETPYGKEAVAAGLDIVAGHRPYLVKRGYIQALVDVRGQGGSQGSFQLFGPDEQADSREVVAWASKLPDSTGVVGMTGESYLGIVQLFAAAAVGPGSPLKAIFPIVTAADPYRDLLTSGGLLNIESSIPLAAVYGALPIASPLFQSAINPAGSANVPTLLPGRAQDVLQGFSVPTVADVLASGDRAYDSAFWGDHRKPVDVVEQVAANGIPAYLVGGFYDVFQRGTPLLYSGLQNAWAGRPAGAPMLPDQKVSGRYQLLLKPQYHTTIDAGEPNLDEIQLAWFDRWLKNERTGIEDTATPLHIAQGDGTRREAARYPLDQAPPRTFFLEAGGVLAGERPTGAGADRVVFTGASLPCDRSTEQWSLGALELALQPFGLGDPCAGEDLVPASAGPGQLAYTTGPLAQDTVLAGPSAVTLHATATTTDSEWVAKLSDVAPDGTSVDLTQGALLGSHRALVEARTWRAPDGLPILPYHPHSAAAQTPVTPGALTRYDVELRPMFATLRAGHRLRLTLLTAQTPHLLALPRDLLNLAGGVYDVQRSAVASSSLQVPLLVLPTAGGAAARPAPARSWYVQAGAADSGTGTKARPFAALERVEAASRPGDRIVVLPASSAAGALGGGIRLKARQRLIGAGPSVVRGGVRDSAPRLTNTDAARLDGDVVRLASGTTVANLVITGALRGAIYGRDITRATIVGNDIADHNTSCTRGFHIPPFAVPTTAPGVGIPISNGLINGWAAIMVDAYHRAGRVTITRNRVHDAQCGDGIDVRVAGDARVRARIDGNDVRELREGADHDSVLAIGLQTRERGRLVARLDGNRQSGLGNDEDSGYGPGGADSEGVFVNVVDASSLRAVISRNTYTHTPGRGGFSANGLEFVSMGSGGRALVHVRDSTFTGTPGDVIEQLALGTKARLRMRLDRVVASGSTGFGGSGYGDTLVIPGNNADCVIGASGGAGNTVDLVIRDSTLTDCANNGLTFGSAVANGSGPTTELRLDVADSRITGNRGGNLRIANVAEIDRLVAKVQRTNLSDSHGTASTPANLTVEDVGSTGSAVIDLGGGPLGSAGGNCLAGGNLAAALVGYDVAAQRNWWGTPGGPGAGRTATAGGALDAGAPLAVAPSGC